MEESLCRNVKVYFIKHVIFWYCRDYSYGTEIRHHMELRQGKPVHNILTISF